MSVRAITSESSKAAGGLDTASAITAEYLVIVLSVSPHMSTSFSMIGRRSGLVRSRTDASWCGSSKSPNTTHANSLDMYADGAMYCLSRMSATASVIAALIPSLDGPITLRAPATAS